jgi:hypothetical protein
MRLKKKKPPWRPLAVNDSTLLEDCKKDETFKILEREEFSLMADDNSKIDGKRINDQAKKNLNDKIKRNPGKTSSIKERIKKIAN